MSPTIKATLRNLNTLTVRIPRAGRAAYFSTSSQTPTCSQCSPRSYPSYKRAVQRCTSQRPLHTSPSHPSKSSSLSKSSGKFSFRIAACCSACYDKFGKLPTNVYEYDLESASHIFPDRSKPRTPSGQDAFFMSRIGDTDSIALGVCDGVGGWAEMGIDPSDFSHGICAYMAEAAERRTDGKSTEWTPRALLQEGFDRITTDPSVKAGGSTACVAIAHSTGHIDIANLGDSGCYHSRVNPGNTEKFLEIKNATRPMLHGFNTPYQLSLSTAKMRGREKLFGPTQIENFPGEAAITRWELQHGDVLLIYTDGFSDNLNPSSILKTIQGALLAKGFWKGIPGEAEVKAELEKHTPGCVPTIKQIVQGQSTGKPQLDPLEYGETFESIDQKTKGREGISAQSALALAAVRYAKTLAHATRVSTPFGENAMKFHPNVTMDSGKPDDTCVIAVLVEEEGRCA